MYEDHPVAQGAAEIGIVESAVSKHLAAFRELSARLTSTVESLARAKDRHLSAAEQVNQLEKERQVIVQEIGGCAVEIERVLSGTTATQSSGPLSAASSQYNFGQKMER